MPAHNPLDILLDTNHWATRQILDACARLSDEQLDRRFEMGLGSLRETITHVIGAMRGWTDLLAGRPFRGRPEQESKKSVAELTAMLDEAATDLAKHARAHPVEESVTRERGGKSYTFTRGGVVTHVTTHGMHHRAQMLNMLRHLGVNPLPQSSVADWMVAGN